MVEFQVFLIFFGPLALIGAVCLFIGLRHRARARATMQWSTTPGNLLSFAITRGRVKNQTHYYPHLEYEYTVDGTRYVSNRISFGYLAYDSEEEAKADLERRIRGNPVQVYYDPKNPKDAVLIPDDASGLAVLIGVGVLLLALPLVFGFYFLLRH